MRTLHSNILVLLLCSLFFNLYTTQAQTLHGILLDNNTGNPVEGARVWIQGGDSFPTTTSDGEFQLNLNTGGFYQLGNQLEIYISNRDYGFHRERITVSQSLREVIKINRGNIIGIFGRVTDKNRGTPLANIEISVASEDFAHPEKVKNLPPAYTDAYGRFQIMLNKGVVGTVKYVRLAFKDQNGNCYEYKERLFNISSYLDIGLKKARCNATSLKIHTYTPRAVAIEMGDQITIEPSGSIRIGTFTGTSTPKGKDGGVFGVSLEAYSFYAQIPHAALMYRCSWEPGHSWKYAGEKLEFIAQRDGYIEFNINDKQQQDNSGAYDVKVNVSK